MPNYHTDSDTEMNEISDEKNDAMSETSDISEMCVDEELDRLKDANENENGSDTDNPYNGEAEDFTADYVFNWITEFQSQGEDGVSEYIEYPDIDYDEIVQRTSSTVLREIIDRLMEEEIENRRVSYFENIKSLTVSADISLNDCNFLEEYLIQMVNDENNETVKYLVDHGADEETAIETAITIDSVIILELFGAEANDELLQLAIDKKAYKVLEYFLEQDFVASCEIILDGAIENSNFQLVDLVCDKAELEHVYDLVKYLVEKGGEKFISVFFKHFDLKDLLIEIQEQDDNRGFYNLVLGHAKDFVSESEISDHEIKKLLASFDKKLQISTQALIYPTTNFRGSSQLKELREALNRNTRIMEKEAKLAINFIGVNLSTVNRYLTLSPNHTSERSKSETYFRSAKHPFSIFVKPATARFEPNPLLPEAKAKGGMGREAHLGFYLTPLDSLNKSKEVKPPQKTKNNKVISGDGLLYNALLHYKRRICNYIANKFSDNNNPFIKVGFYHDYPCVMVWIPKPAFVIKPTERALEAWTEIVISYFVGLVNYLAQTKNLNIELVRRSSFSFLSPSIAPCGQSFRLSVGIIPTDYADIINAALAIVNEVLQTLEQPIHILNQQKLTTKLPDMCFIKSTAYKNYMQEKTIPPVKNLLELLWAKVERAGNTGAFNLMRTSAARDGLSYQVYKEIYNTSPQTTLEYTRIFLNALRWGMSKINVVGKTLQFNSYEKFEFNKLLKTHAVIADTVFLNFIAQLIKTIQIQIESLPDGLIRNNMNKILLAVENNYKEKIIGDLYFYLEMFNELLFSKTIFTFSAGHTDDFGSDSEIDDESDEDENPFKSTELKVHCYGKKVVVQNGMRAILGALHAGAHFLFPRYLKSTVKPTLFLYGAYYETPEALKLLTKFKVFREIDGIRKAKIMIYDINSCVTEGAGLLPLKENNFKKIEVLIIDSTSASIAEHQHWIKVFQSQAQMQILFFVSSGFKNEQMGADKNPYGTIRLFTKDKQIQKDILAFIKKHEQPIQSSISHHYRRSMKKMGNTPCNHTIFFAPQPKAASQISGKNNDDNLNEVVYVSSSFRK